MKLNLVVTDVVERAKSKGTIEVTADEDIHTFKIFSTLNIKAKRGEFEVGDRITVTVEKA